MPPERIGRSSMVPETITLSIKLRGHNSLYYIANYFAYSASHGERVAHDRMIHMPYGKTIVFARHGETNFNRLKQIQDPIEPHLTTKGHMQAHAIGKKIQEQGWQFDAVFCADTTRTRETLVDICLPNRSKNNIHITSFLNERFHEDLVGKNKEDITTLVGDIKDGLSWELYFEGTNKSVLTGKFSNNETLQNVQERVKKLIM